MLFLRLFPPFILKEQKGQNIDGFSYIYCTMYRESSRYAHFGTGKNSHKWKIAYLESNVVMPCKVNLTIRMSNAQSSTYTV